MDPTVLADPYPLYKKLRETDPVHWDPFLHAWVVTGYQDCITVLHKMSAGSLMVRSSAPIPGGGSRASWSTMPRTYPFSARIATAS